MEEAFLLLVFNLQNLKLGILRLTPIILPLLASRVELPAVFPLGRPRGLDFDLLWEPSLERGIQV